MEKYQKDKMSIWTFLKYLFRERAGEGVSGKLIEILPAINKTGMKLLMIIGIISLFPLEGLSQQIIQTNGLS